ncbi:MAG: cyclase family protein [Anaerolineae bacterium]|nr:cyclase family protein [Anaerolineae bacterium]
MRIYDVTVPISERMPVWPGDPPVQIERVSELSGGDSFNVSRLHIGSHTGTHVDAPAHFLPQGQTVDRLPLDVLVGPAIVLDMEDVPGKTIQALDLANLHPPRSTRRLLLRTRNSNLWADRQTEFEPEYVHLDPKAASWLVQRGIRLVGLDYLSVEAFQSATHNVHRILLEAGLVVVEGLDLSNVPAGPCQLVCLPLKIEGGDGAPARVLVIRD